MRRSTWRSGLSGRLGLSTRLTLSVLLALVMMVIGVAALVTTPGVSQATSSTPLYYLSLGDSYSTGFEPSLGSTAGYTAHVAKKLRLTLENFGCNGATTVSILHSTGCGSPASVNAVPYPATSQEAAALAFIAAHPGNVGLITVSIGGNDLASCLTQPDPSCRSALTGDVEPNLVTLVTDLRAALDANSDNGTKIIGLTYPDAILGSLVYPTVQTTSIRAADSVYNLDSLFNPALQAIYTEVAHGGFVDVTSARYRRAKLGDDTNTFDTTTGVSTGPTMVLPPYGKIPTSVWEICTLTFYCSQGDVHANDKGYAFIGKLIVAASRSIP